MRHRTQLNSRLVASRRLPLSSCNLRITPPPHKERTGVNLNICTADLLRTMQSVWRFQTRKSKAMRFVHGIEQAQWQPPQARHLTARLSPSTSLHDTAAAAAAVMFCSLCIIGMAAAQPGQCPAAWTTAVLSVARGYFAATSLPSQGLAIFAGGVAASGPGA
jgi:hypothetical protein